MINKFELRPGNRVYCSSFGHTVDLSDLNETFCTANYSGIELCEESLKSLGFKENDFVGSIFLDSEKRTYQFFEGGIWLIAKDTQQEIPLLEIEYVHQLQNLYQLLEKKPLEWKD